MPGGRVKIVCQSSHRMLTNSVCNNNVYPPPTTYYCQNSTLHYAGPIFTFAARIMVSQLYLPNRCCFVTFPSFPLKTILYSECIHCTLCVVHAIHTLVRPRWYKKRALGKMLIYVFILIQSDKLIYPHALKQNIKRFY